MTNNGEGSAGMFSGSGSLEATLKDLERIARETNPILRNLLITQRYHDLSHSLASVIGSGNANWSTFASWASKTAGQSIRGEGLPEEVARLLADEAAFDARVAELTRAVPFLHFLYIDLDVFDVARAIVEEVSAQIAEGNLKVFAELTPLLPDSRRSSRVRGSRATSESTPSFESSDRAPRTTAARTRSSWRAGPTPTRP